MGDPDPDRPSGRDQRGQRLGRRVRGLAEDGRFRSAAQNHEFNASIVYFLLSMVNTIERL